MSDKGQNRFVVSLQPGKTAEETANRVLQETVSLVEQLNAANIPISIGPNDPFPEGMKVGQVVIDWSSGVSVLKVFNGSTLV